MQYFCVACTYHVLVLCHIYTNVHMSIALKCELCHSAVMNYYIILNTWPSIKDIDIPKLVNYFRTGARLSTSIYTNRMYTGVYVHVCLFP